MSSEVDIHIDGHAAEGRKGGEGTARKGIGNLFEEKETAGGGDVDEA